MASARYQHTETALQDGRILIVGGEKPSASKSAELFRP